ncbi:MAG: hypothetical protein Fur0037_17960 [Planctomycetota bacterium]
MSRTTTDRTIVYLGLGSNLGDRRAAIETALRRLADHRAITIHAVSSLREYPFEGEGPKQGDYLNGVARLEVAMSPAELLALCKELERQAGREIPSPRNHPRPLDLDILIFGDRTIDEEGLVVPHPRLFDRRFVTGPLRELGVDLASFPAPRRAEIVRDPVVLSARCRALVSSGIRLGLVPTMGALHAGHRSLLERARAECDRVVATIFVNPLQFGPSEDFAVYPRDLEGDVAICREVGADLVFAPSVESMYPPGFCSRIRVGKEAEGMEGACRPGHFEGVATVVARLFALTSAQRAYFGQKDAQQVAVIRRMARDLGFPIEIVECPTVREGDGLALSSRNAFLAPEDRRACLVLHRALARARDAFAAGERDRDALLELARSELAKEPRAEVDYLELRAEGDLEPLPEGPVADGRMLVAARFHGGARPVRLIDNLPLRGGP